LPRSRFSSCAQLARTAIFCPRAVQAVETAVVPGIFLAATTRATCARAYFLADSTSLHPPLRPTARRAPCLRPSQPSYPCARACSCRGFIRRYVFDFSVTVHTHTGRVAPSARTFSRAPPARLSFSHAQAHSTSTRHARRSRSAPACLAGVCGPPLRTCAHARAAQQSSRRARTSPTDALRPVAQADAFTAPPTHGCSLGISGAFSRRCASIRVVSPGLLGANRACMSDAAPLRANAHHRKSSPLYQPRPCLPLPPR